MWATGKNSATCFKTLNWIPPQIIKPMWPKSRCKLCQMWRGEWPLAILLPQPMMAQPLRAEPLEICRYCPSRGQRLKVATKTACNAEDSKLPRRRDSDFWLRTVYLCWWTSFPDEMVLHLLRMQSVFRLRLTRVLLCDKYSLTVDTDLSLLLFIRNVLIINHILCRHRGLFFAIHKKHSHN